MPCSRSAAPCPARSPRCVAPGQRAGVAAGGGEAREQLARAVRRRDADQVVRARGRAAAASSGATRMAGASTTVGAQLAQPRGQRAGLRARARDRDRAAVQRPRSSQASDSRSAATGPTSVTAGARIPAAAARSATSPSVASTVRWPGSVPRSTTATGSVGRAGRRRSAARRSAAARARPCRRRACRGTRRAPASRAPSPASPGSSWPVTNATPRGELALRHRDAGVGRRRDAGGDARHDLERDAGRRAAPAPPRRRARTRTGRRP